MPDTLSEREADVVSMRFGLADGQPKALDEIGKVRGHPGADPADVQAAPPVPIQPPPGLPRLTGPTAVSPGCNQRSPLARLVDAQNARIRTASIVTGIEP